MQPTEALTSQSIEWGDLLSIHPVAFHIPDAPDSKETEIWSYNVTNIKGYINSTLYKRSTWLGKKCVVSLSGSKLMVTNLNAN